MPVPGLDPGVRGAVDARIDLGRDRLVRPRVVLRGEEQPEVRLVPDRVEADEGISPMPAGVAVCDRLGELPQVCEFGRRVVLAPPMVGPLRRAPDRQHHLHPVEAGVADELVEVREPVRPVERVGGVPRLLLRDARPVDGRADDPDMRLLRQAEIPGAVGAPAKGRVVLQADQHPRVRQRRGRRENRGEHECDQWEEEGEAKAHRGLRALGRPQIASRSAEGEARRLTALYQRVDS